MSKKHNNFSLEEKQLTLKDVCHGNILCSVVHNVGTYIHIKLNNMTTYDLCEIK